MPTSPFIDDRGVMHFASLPSSFKAVRFYTIHNHMPMAVRAWHGHVLEEKYLIVTKGAFKVGVKAMDNEEVPKVHHLNTGEYLFIPAGHYNGFQNYTNKNQLLILSNKSYAESIKDDHRKPWDTWHIWGTSNR